MKNKILVVDDDPFNRDILQKQIRKLKLDCELCCSGEEAIEFRYMEGKKTTRKRHPFEGIIPNLERRFRETESATVREELAKYLGLRACPDCGVRDKVDFEAAD